MIKIRPSEITPEHIYLSRRRFMKGAAQLIAGTALLAACGGPTGVTPTPPAPGVGSTPGGATAASPTATPTAMPTDELGNPLTPKTSVEGYNNYYEFALTKQLVADAAKDFVTSPWSVQVGGLVANPRRFDLDDLRALGAEERIYRLRCVEAWSMVIPWTGFSLSKLLAEVEPTSEARYVRFETAYDEAQMPGLSRDFPWPYVEGLRLDEALHDLTILATGVYGKDLPPQNGAPVRLVVPWKYGFKSLKTIRKIDLVAEMPDTFWALTGPSEYGFWANVNPKVPHPRWSQATETAIGENRRKETLFLNGYADEVASLYDDIDNAKWYR